MLLTDLSRCHGVSGVEGEVRALLRELLIPVVDEVQTDALGNLLCHNRATGGEEGPLVMLAAHLDEVGLMVTKIEQDGRVCVQPVGEVDPRVLPGKVVYVGPERVPGIIGGKPIHLQERDERDQPYRWTDLHLDLGASSAHEASTLVKLGDRVVFAAEPGPLGEGMLKGRAFDDRAGCTVLAEVLAERYPFPVCGVFTAQEEVGMRGARVAAYRLTPDLAIALEGTTASDVPETPAHLRSTCVGQGPAITLMDASVVVRPRVVERLLAVAEREGIPHQLRRLNVGETDAGPIATSRGGVPAVTVSVPTRYIHAPVTALASADLEATIRLVKAFLRSIGEEGLPR